MASLTGPQQTRAWPCLPLLRRPLPIPDGLPGEVTMA